MSAETKRAMQLDVQTILERMRTERCNLSKLQGQGPSSGVMQVVRDMLTEAAESDTPTIAGKLMTRIMRLPGRQRALLMEFVNVAPAYRGKDLHLSILVRNNGSTTIDALTDTTIVPHIGHDTGLELDTHDIEETRQALPPGEAIALSVELAGVLLHERCKNAWNPTARSWPHERDDVEEVGFTYIANGQPIQVGAAKPRRGRKAA